MKDLTSSTVSKRALAYVRVSTDEQAKHQTSLESQVAQIERWCERQGIDLAQVFIEPGLSGTDENRPQFKRMMAEATREAAGYQAVIVYSLSRFARDVALQITSYRRLKLAGVELLSVTETFAKGSAGNLMRSVVGVFNQHFSDETSTHTIRTMRANAADGFYNGGPTPFGYRSVVAERRGGKDKKRLQIDEAEAGVVRLIFDLAIAGDGHGPMGVRAIAAHLNKRGDTLRGGRFHNSNVADILGRLHYVGHYLDGKRDDDGDPLPESEWVRVPCPSIIDADTFAAAAARRTERRPRTKPPRVVNGVTMLPAAIARCGEPGCGAGLTVRSGKGGRYHYYTCEHRVNRSRDACTLPAIRREQLDAVVLDALDQRILQPDHLERLLAGMLDRSDAAEARKRKTLASARAARTDALKAVANLLTLVERGGLSPDDAMVVDRIAHQRARERTMATQIDSLERQLSISKRKVTPEMIRRFGMELSRRLRTGEPNFRRAYVSMLVDRVELSAGTIRISGTRAALEHALITDEHTPPTVVPIFDREWCPEEDSNLHGLATAST